MKLCHNFQKHMKLPIDHYQEQNDLNHQFRVFSSLEPGTLLRLESLVFSFFGQMTSYCGSASSASCAPSQQSARPVCHCCSSALLPQCSCPMHCPLLTESTPSFITGLGIGLLEDLGKTGKPYCKQIIMEQYTQVSK